jgi:Xaa-Pro aminopeptidase
LDWVVVTQLEHIQYLIGPRFGWTFQPLAALRADGHALLVAPDRRLPEVHAADEVHAFEAQWHSTLRNDQRQVACGVLAGVIQDRGAGRRLGIEYSTWTAHWGWQGELVDVEPDLLRLRRQKGADELARLCAAIEATERMYERARAMIAPGVNELDVFSELQAVAVRHLGEPLTGTGNDYQCGSRGGPPRDRVAEAGELYILDLGPAYRGYFADNCRTVAVTDPSPAQLAAWKHVVEVLDLVESEVKPGVSARRLFEQAQQLLDRAPVGVFNHHLGHGIGLFPHEAPHLNPHWDDVFEVGDVFTAEPGLYSPELRAGMRIENDYLVTESGVRCLTNFPLELKL